MLSIENSLGFNPVSDSIKVFEMDVTPQMAQYILLQHNNDNRKNWQTYQQSVSSSIAALDLFLHEEQSPKFAGPLAQGVSRGLTSLLPL